MKTRAPERPTPTDAVETANAIRALEALPFSIAIVANDGIILSANRAWLGKPNSSICPCRVGDNYFDYLESLGKTTDTSGLSISDSIRAVANGLIQFLQTKTALLTSGSLHSLEIDARPLVGRPGGLVVVHRFELADKNSTVTGIESRYRAAAAASLDALFLLKAVREGSGQITDFEFVELNSSGEKLFSKIREQIVGRKLSEILPTLRTEGYLEKYARVVETREPLEEEIPIDAPGLTASWLHQRVWPWEDGIAIAAQDITARKRMEQTLREAEARFQNLADSAPVLIWMSDVNAKVEYFNKRWLDFTGMTSDEQLGDGWKTVVHPDDVPGVLEVGMGAFEKREVFQVEYRLRRNDGEYRWVEAHGAPRYTPSGEFAGYIGTCFDVTEQKAALEALRIGEECYRRVVEAETELVCRFTPDTKLTFVNEAYCRFFKGSREELLGKSFLELLPPKVCDVLRSDMESLLANPRDAVFEQRVTFPDGRECWQQWVDHPIRDDRGCVVEFQAVGRDITERKLAEEELRRARDELEVRVQSRTRELEATNQHLLEVIALGEKIKKALQFSLERFDLMVAGSQQGLWDAEIRADDPYCPDNPVYWSPRFKELLGFGDDDFPHTLGAWSTRLHPDDRDRVFKALDAFLFQREPYDIEYRMFTKSGEQRWFAARGQCIWDAAGKPVRASGSFADISARKQAEEQARKHQGELAHVLRLTTMGEMATTLAHELNQPLAAIANYTQGTIRRMRAGAGDSQNMLDALEQVAGQAARAGEVIRRIRSFVRKEEPKRIATNVNHLVRQAAAFLESDARTHEISMRLELAEGLPDVMVDGVQIEQVLLNLCRNAFDALNVCSNDRTVMVRSRAAGELGVELSVFDNGPGLPIDEQERIFQPFYTTKPDGMGMGLAISKSIIEAHNGSLWVTSGPNAGAIFHFVLPVADRRTHDVS